MESKGCDRIVGSFPSGMFHETPQSRPTEWYPILSNLHRVAFVVMHGISDTPIFLFHIDQLSPEFGIEYCRIRLNDDSRDLRVTPILRSQIPCPAFLLNFLQFFYDE